MAQSEYALEPKRLMHTLTVIVQELLLILVANRM